MKKIFIYWLPVIFWAGLIYFFSHQPDLKSDLPGKWDFILRKAAHLTEYLILTWLLWRAFSRTAKFSINQYKLLLLSILLSVAYATTDEIHQGFVFNRQPALRDVFIDSCGAMIGAWLIRKKMIK